MVRDVNATYLFGVCEDKRVVVFKCRKHVAKERIDLNDGTGGNLEFPFFRSDGVTDVKTYVTRITFEWLEASKEVVRRACEGILTLSTSATDAEIVGLSFSATGDEKTRILAKHVDVFDLRYFGYSIETPRRLVSLQVGRNDARFLGTSRSERLVAMMVVHFKAKYDFASSKFRDSVMEIKTKIWSYKLMNDAIYSPYFSSADLDTRY